MNQPQSLLLGIHTQGSPEVSQLGDGRIRIENALIGSGFHWERVYPLSMRAEVVSYGADEPGIGLVVRIGVEDYLKSVVSSEMSGNAPDEYIKAHAIISRSWLLGKISGAHEHSSEGKVIHGDEITDWADTADHTGFHVCNDDHCQRFQGDDAITAKAERAVESTAGLILADSDGNVIDARFSKCCGGVTELFSTCWQNIDYDFLASFRDPYCSEIASMRKDVLSTVMKEYDMDSTPVMFGWKQRVTPQLIERRLNELYGIKAGTVTDMVAISRGPSGRISRLLLKCSERDITVGKELVIRRLLSESHLLSSNFTIEKSSDGFILTGNGWGHGAGLCQTGAAVMALKGMTAEEILKFYYPNTYLKVYGQEK